MHEKNSLVTNRGTSVFFVPTNVAAVTLAANHKYRLESVKLGVTNIPTFLHDLATMKLYHPKCHFKVISL